MKSAWLCLAAAGALSAQSVSGPVLGYVIDDTARMRPLFGMAAAAHVGAAVRGGVVDSWGPLALLADGTALRNGEPLEGTWAGLQPGAFLDASGRELLIAPERSSPWRLALPDRALAVRVSSAGTRVATLMADESIAVWSAGAKAEFRLPASKWWSLAFAAERLLAYDPAENALLLINGVSGPSLLRKLDGPGARYSLAVDASGKYAILLGERLLLVPLAGGAVREFTPPDGADRLEALRDGTTFLLTRQPSRPLWLLDTGREDALLVIPAVAPDNGGRQ